MHRLASEEPFPTWANLSSHTPCGLALSAFTEKAGSCSNQLSKRTLPGSPSASASQTTPKRERHFQFSTGGRMHAGVLLTKPRLTLATGLVNVSPERTGLFLKLHCYIVTFCPVHEPCVQWLVPFHLCLALRHLRLHSSLPAPTSLTHPLVIKLRNILEHFPPALLSSFIFIFSISPCHHKNWHVEHVH